MFDGNSLRRFGNANLPILAFFEQLKGQLLLATDEFELSLRLCVDEEEEKLHARGVVGPGAIRNPCIRV